MKAVKVAVLAAPCEVLTTLHDVSAAPSSMLGALCGVLAAQDTPGGLEGPSGRGGTIHEQFLWSRIA